MKWLLLLVLTGCAAPVAVPEGLRDCPAGERAPDPPRLRTVETLAQWSIKIELANEATERALAECDRKRAEAVRLLEKTR